MKTDKEKIKQTILSLEKEKLKYVEESYKEYLSSAKLDSSEIIDDQSRSLAQQNSALAAQFECPLHNHEEAINKVSKIDFSKKDQVQLGAIVDIGEKSFVVSVATGAFKVDDISYIGISENAPIFKAMEGSHEGDSFEINGREFTINKLS